MAALEPPVDPARDHASGPDGAVTLVEYADFECPYCSDAHAAVKDLQRRAGDSVRFVFRQLPLDKHPYAREAALAAEAAAAQGSFWEMHDRLFEGAPRLDSATLRSYAQEIGLDMERFERDIASEETAARVDGDLESARASDVQGTPAFFLDGQPYEGRYDAESLGAAVAARGSR